MEDYYGERCAEHGLALAPDRLCVVCRRERGLSAPPAAQASPYALIYRVLVLGSVSIALVAGAVLVPRAFNVVAERMNRLEAVGAEPLPAVSPELAVARAEVSITMYSTRWCGVCRHAKAYMSSRSIAYQELDVERNAAAARAHREKNPQRTVPTFDIDGRTLVGFHPAGLEEAIDQAAARRR